MRQLLFGALLVTACGSESSSPDPSGTSAPSTAPAAPTAAPLPTPAPASPPSPASPPPSAASADPDTLAAIVDPSGRTRVVAHETRGPRRYALVLTDASAEAWAEVLAMPDGEALARAWDELSGRCLHLDEPLDVLRCQAAFTPRAELLAEGVAERGWRWEAVVVEGANVVARRPLVALSVHDPAREGEVRATMNVRDVDGDGRDELSIEVPFAPLRDDGLFVWGDRERGGLRYVLDASLDVQARFTSAWSWSESMDDGDSPPRSSACSVTDTIEADGALRLEEDCDGELRHVRCPYDAAADRFRCPPRFAAQLLEPWSRESARYVGETPAELRRQLPMLGTALDELRRWAAAHPDEEDPEAIEAAPDEAPSTTPTAGADGPVAAAPSSAPVAGACRVVVEDPAPPLRVRSEPSSRARVVGELPNGAELRLIERRGRWARIEAPHAGWVWTENVRERCGPTSSTGAPSSPPITR